MKEYYKTVEIETVIFAIGDVILTSDETEIIIDNADNTSP